MLKLSDFNYHLPKSLIAQKPAKPRDHSRLLVMERKTGRIEHKHFYDIIDYLKKGDCLVLNNSKVFPARLIGKKKGTGGRIEVLLLEKYKPLTPPLSGGHFQTPLYPPFGRGVLLDPPCKGGLRGFLWLCLLGGKGRKEGLKVEFGKGLKCEVIKNNSAEGGNDGTWLVQFNKPYKKMMKVVGRIGCVPLPPYIKRGSTSLKRSSLLADDIINYQTVYADDKKIGSVAASTAGFHFTPALLKKIKDKGVQIEFITLHVGLGTFAPVKTEDITKHKMRSEWVEIKKDVAQIILKAKKEGGRIIAVGTTTVRTLEGVLGQSVQNQRGLTSFREVEPLIDKSQVSNFIYPGYKFQIVDALITNFHLPKSTLLILVSAFADNNNKDYKKGRCCDGINKMKKIYAAAIKKKYRFYSYGDAMFIY